jgi:hypothetical protein
MLWEVYARRRPGTHRIERMWKTVGVGEDAMRRLWVILLLAMPAKGQAGAARPSAIVSADAFSDGDVGDRVAAAFRSVGGTASRPAQGVVVNLSPDRTYDYRVPIVLPNRNVSPYVVAPVLDCHGAVLNWTQPGAMATDMVTVRGESDYKSGEIRNCKFTSAAGAAAQITFHSRIDFSVNHTYFGVPVIFVNDMSPGSATFTEENHWDDIQMNVIGTSARRACGISFVNDATLPKRDDLGSFFYNWFNRIHIDLGGNANGICLVGSANMPPRVFGSNFDLHVNAGGAHNTVIWLGPGTQMMRGLVTMTGEYTAGGSPETQRDVYASAGAAFYTMGGSTVGFPHEFAPGVAHSQISYAGGPEVLANSLAPAGAGGTRTLTGEPLGTNAARQCETEQLGLYPTRGITAILLASYGMENGCVWEIASRVTTDAYPDVDVEAPAGKNPLTTRIFVSSLGGVGFGPGFTSGDYAKSTVEVRGQLTVRGVSPGSLVVRDIDAGGNVEDTFLGGLGLHYRQRFSDLSGRGGAVDGLDCHAHGQVYCAVPNLATGTAANTDFAGQLRLSAGGTATYRFSGTYASAPICTASDTSAVAATQVGTTPAMLTVRGGAGDEVNYVCVGRN